MSLTWQESGTSGRRKVFRKSGDCVCVCCFFPQGMRKEILIQESGKKKARNHLCAFRITEDQKVTFSDRQGKRDMPQVLGRSVVSFSPTRKKNETPRLSLKWPIINVRHRLRQRLLQDSCTSCFRHRCIKDPVAKGEKNNNLIPVGLPVFYFFFGVN